MKQTTTQVVTRVISAVIPAFGEVELVRNSVVSLATQWIPDNTFKLEVIIVNDNPNRDYTFFQKKDFKKIVGKNVFINIINNDTNVGQGFSRQIGIDNAMSNWILLCDEDDMYAPNAVYRFWEILNEQHRNGNDGKPVALIAAPVYGFDENKERLIINSHSIWVNGKLYNREFLKENQIYFPCGDNSFHAEDYPFIEQLNYAIDNSKFYKRIDFDDTADTFYYWIPNRKSQSRKERFYTAMLTPLTMNASLLVYDYMKRYNKYYNIENDQEEFMKFKILSISVYSYYAYVKWLHDMALGWKDDERFTESVWSFYKEVMKNFKNELLVYWKEICPSNIMDVCYGIKHSSDIQYIESWIEPFNEWINNGMMTLNMSYDEIKDYCGKLKFDEVNHEVHSDYVQAWCRRKGVES